MTVTIQASTSPGEIRVAAVRDGALLDYSLWHPGAPDGVGDLYRGRVVAVVPGMAGAFVALTNPRAFSPTAKAPRPSPPAPCWASGSAAPRKAARARG